MLQLQEQETRQDSINLTCMRNQLPRMLKDSPTKSSSWQLALRSHVPSSSSCPSSSFNDWFQQVSRDSDSSPSALRETVLVPPR